MIVIAASILREGEIMSKGNYANIQWADQDAHRYYLVTWGVADKGYEHAPFGLASMSEITDKLATEAFQDAIGEGSNDVVCVWRLTDHGPKPVDITYAGGPGGTEVKFTWRIGAHRFTEVAFYTIPEV